MGSMWDKVNELVEHYGQGGVWIRLKNDGDKFTGMFLGEPYPRECYYDPKENRYFPYDEDAKKRKEKLALRIGFCVGLPPAEGADPDTVKIFEMSVQTYKALLAVRDKYGLSRFFEVQRKGEEGDTKTTYTILPEDPCAPELLAKMNALELPDIEAEYAKGEDDADAKPNSKEGVQKEFKAKSGEKKAETKTETKTTAAAPTNGTPTNGTNGSIDPKVSQTISVLLKELPDMKSGVQEFLAAFKCAKIKDVPKAKEAEAIALAQAIAKKQGVGEEPAKEVDPFE